MHIKPKKTRTAKVFGQVGPSTECDRGSQGPTFLLFEAGLGLACLWRITHLSDELQPASAATAQ